MHNTRALTHVNGTGSQLMLLITPAFTLQLDEKLDAVERAGSGC